MVINFDGGSGISPAQVQEMIDYSTRNFLTSAQTQEIVDSALTEYSTTEETQDLIDTALTKYQRVLNVVSAPAEELKSGVTIPNYCVFAINYSGKTYFEQYREETDSGQSVTVYFYVIGAQADEEQYNIYDLEIGRKINKATGAVSLNNRHHSYAPGVIYNLDNMNLQQKRILSYRMANMDLYKNRDFYATWTYNNTLYGKTERYHSRVLTGYAFAFEENEIRFCFISSINNTPYLSFNDEWYSEMLYKNRTDNN